MPNDRPVDPAEARRRALRAARAVTLAAGALLAGCAASVGGPGPDEGAQRDGGSVADAATPSADRPAAAEDTQPVVADAGRPTDAGAVTADAGGAADADDLCGEGSRQRFEDWSAWFEACCHGPEPLPVACTPWGPFMPPEVLG